MSIRIAVAGTDTNIGKTVFAAGLTRALDGAYWKPVQAGLDGATDSDTVRVLAGLDAARIVPEAYRLRVPASPHFSAEHDGLAIDPAALTLPNTTRPLVVELAGGLLVPFNRTTLQIDMLAAWKIPLVLVAATRLGTINHTLLSIEALKRRAIPILGVAYIGDEHSDSRRTIGRFGGVKDLGRLPILPELTANSLARAFSEVFDVADILGLGARGP